MLDFAEQTGSGILIAVWSFLTGDLTCNIDSHIIYLYAYLYFHAHIRVHISNIHAMLYNITHVCDLHTSPSAYKEEVSLLSCNSYYTQCSDKRQNRPVNPKQLPQHDTCPIRKFHPYSHYSIHAMHAQKEREICAETHYSYQRKCRHRYGWYVLYDNSFCSQRFCYYAARSSHEEITSSFPSRNYGGGIGISGPCFPFRLRGAVIWYSE